MSLTNK